MKTLTNQYFILIMKNFNLPTNLKVALLGLLFVSFILSCETEQMDEMPNALAKSQTQTALRLYQAADCSTDCIEADIEDYFVKSESSITNPGKSSNEKTVTYYAYNTPTEFVVEVIYEISGGNANAKADFVTTINGTVWEDYEVPSGVSIIHTYDLTAGYDQCEEMKFSIEQTALGKPIKFDSTYNLFAVCPDECEESFSYELNEDSSYTFTYISEESLEDAEVKFTCPHITGFYSLDGKSYDVNPGKGQGAPTVLTYVGDIEACTPITFTMSFDADCEQNAAGFANMFTDFKVNEVSKKGDAGNIRIECNN
ncbi:hypothetical protein SAMN03097699_2185 [Flavobacteriaceae bacterium MAR_2010_188]|nr:hypothetical protein SAMN03097699_2185 [Flavobacteriaceae bacterium MAR_2010_188]